MKTTDREIGRKFETLSRLSGSLSTAYIEFMASRANKADRKAAAIALVKRFHLQALRLKGEELAYQDQQLIEEFTTFVRWTQLAAKTPVAFRNPGGESRKRDLSKTLKSALAPHLGKPELLERGIWKYETVTEPFRVLTYVDVGGRVPLRYSHKVVGRNGILYHTSLLHWHGIATETTWDLMKPNDVQNSAELLADLCKRFLAAMTAICADRSGRDGAASGSL